MSTNFQATLETMKAAGRDAYENGRLRAPAADATVMAWLEANEPEVGDPRTIAVMKAFTAGCDEAAHEAGLAILGLN